MNQSDYHAFTQALLDCLQDDPRVLGLVALGSMAGRDYQPDEWSDHDFFVITREGEQESFRQDPGWLPQHEEIVLHFRETAHGVKVLYASGHLLEYAVFSLTELRQAKINRYQVLMDQGGVRAAVEEVVVSTLRSPASSDEYLFGQFLANLLVGAGRDMRGEALSGRQFVKSFALGHLLKLLEKYVPPEQKNQLDNLDPFRRFERTYPRIGQEINAVLGAPTVQSARLLLDLAERELSGRQRAGWPAASVQAVRRILLKMEQERGQASMPWD